MINYKLIPCVNKNKYKIKSFFFFFIQQNIFSLYFDFGDEI